MGHSLGIPSDVLALLCTSFGRKIILGVWLLYSCDINTTIYIIHCGSHGFSSNHIRYFRDPFQVIYSYGQIWKFLHFLLLYLQDFFLLLLWDNFQLFEMLVLSDSTPASYKTAASASSASAASSTTSPTVNLQDRNIPRLAVTPTNLVHMTFFIYDKLCGCLVSVSTYGWRAYSINIQWYLNVLNSGKKYLVFLLVVI